MEKKDKKDKGGYITDQEKNDIHSRAKRTLEQVKHSKREQNKIPYRVDHRTIIMVSKKKYKELIKNKK